MKYRKKIKEVVVKLLREDPRCRSNDTWLFFCVLKELGIKFFINYKDLKKIPALETITKCRRATQNQDNEYNTEEFIPEEGTTYEKPILK